MIRSELPCGASPDPRRYGTTLVEACTQHAGHTGTHTSRDRSGTLTGWHYPAPGSTSPEVTS